MKLMQEYSDTELTPSGEIPLRCIEKLPLPYTGNKKKLCYQIHDALIKHNIQFESVLDAFTGSATVAYLFKLMGKRVIANDLLTSAYVNAVAFVENDHIKLSEEEQQFLLHNQNPNKNTFVEDNYLGTQYRQPGKEYRFNKFTINECRHLDNFRANIDELCSKESQSVALAANAAIVMRLPFGQMDASVNMLEHRVKQQKNYGIDSDKHDRRIGIYYDKDLNLKFDKWFTKYVKDFSAGIKNPVYENKIKRAAFLANIQQHVLRDCMVQGRLNHGQSLAEVEVRLNHPKNQLKDTWDRETTEMDFFTKTGAPGQGLKWWTFSGVRMDCGQCIATNMDILYLLKSGLCNVDCCYFDPPYGNTSSNYPSMYRFFEEYIYSQPLEELKHISKYGHKFTKKKTYRSEFIEMLENARHIPIWLFSFNDSSWTTIEQICGIIKEFKTEVVTEILDNNYRYTYRSRQGRDKKSFEYLLIAR